MHTQGSGKSLTMVWLAKWLREHQTDPRVLLIADRAELGEQIERIFNGVDENIYRTSSGADLIATLNQGAPRLIRSLVHRFRVSEEGKARDEADSDCIASAASPPLRPTTDDPRRWSTFSCRKLVNFRLPLTPLAALAPDARNTKVDSSIRREGCPRRDALRADHPMVTAAAKLAGHIAALRRPTSSRSGLYLPRLVRSKSP